MLTIGALGISNPSLEGMISFCGLDLQRVSLHGRFTREAVVFLEKCLDFVFKARIRCEEKLQGRLFDHFKNVYIFDSSVCELNPRIKNIFPGTGGCGSDASCKIQLGYEVKKGIISLFRLTSGRSSDSRFMQSRPVKFLRNDLILFDLGYFSLKTFSALVHQGSYFLSRFMYQTALYDPVSCEQINFAERLKQVKSTYQATVLMGKPKEDRILCRIVAIRANEEIVSQRRRGLKRRCGQKRRQPSKEALDMCNWTIMVTNISQEWLPLDMVTSLYSLRWQIELLFKQIKSQLRIEKINTAKEYRCRCEILGKMIMAILIQQVHSHYNIKIWNSSRREVSIEKLYKRLNERAKIILDLILKKTFNSFIKYMTKEMDLLMKTCRKGVQKNRRNIMELLEFGPVDKYLIP